MNSDQGHAVEVVDDDFQSALGATRLLRLSLDVLDGRLPPDAATDSVRQALWSIREWIAAAELKELRRRGLPRQYAIIAPINPLTMPSSQDMGRIAAAIRTLDDLGLLVRPDE